MKSAQFRSYSVPYFPAFGLNTDQNNSEYGHFLHSGNLRLFAGSTETLKQTREWNKYNRWFLLLTIYKLKVVLSPSKKLFYFLQWKPFNFYFFLKALFIPKVFKSLSWLFGHVEKMAWNVGKIYDVTTCLTNNTNIAHLT